MSQLIPLYITGPFAPGMKSRGEAQNSSQSVCMHSYEPHQTQSQSVQL